MWRRCVPVLIVVVLGIGACGRNARGQAPTIDSGLPPAPGGGQSTLGPSPGSGMTTLGNTPGGSQGILGGSPGAAVPRVPPQISMPGGTYAGPPERGGIQLPTPLPNTELPNYGTLDFPSVIEEEGPPQGMTLDQAIERLVRDNLDLRSKFFELPQADADTLTAGLRANPLLYIDGQLIPYGQYSRARPGGQTQYDINISYPLDVSLKRIARTRVAQRARGVLEAQYQDAVRLQIDNLYTVFVDNLAARKTVRYFEASVEGLDRIAQPLEDKVIKGVIVPAVLSRAQIQRETAEIGLMDARETYRRTKRSLATLLNIPPAEADSLEVRGSIVDKQRKISEDEVLTQIALDNRPDLVAFRLGVHRAEADVKLALANRYADVYVLYQPYTFQNNAPYGLKSPTSWALGVTVPLPVYNRNQGNIQRARLNVSQTQTELASLMRQVFKQVQDAEIEYKFTLQAVERIEKYLVPAARKVLETADQRYRQGQDDVITYLNTRQEYVGVVKQYLDTLVRHRRSMLDLNTAVGQRLLP